MARGHRLLARSGARHAYGAGVARSGAREFALLWAAGGLGLDGPSDGLELYLLGDITYLLFSGGRLPMGLIHAGLASMRGAGAGRGAEFP